MILNLEIVRVDSDYCDYLRQFDNLGIVKTIVIILFTGIIAFAMGYINEKKANGSILPSWFIHALSNIFASIIAMFSLI